MEDHRWFPPIFRRFQAEYIGSVVNWFGLYDQLVPILQKMTDNYNPQIIQDLCAGSGLPTRYIQERIKGIPKTILTDKFPYRYFKDTNQISYIQEQVDVKNLVPDAKVCYSIYNGFHHFSGDEQRAIVKKMVDAGSPFLIAEVLTPGIISLIRVMVSAVLLQLVTAPFVKPFSYLRLLFTYIIPVNLFTVTIDGFISVFRSKTARQYTRLFASLSTNEYQISINQFSNFKASVICITGNPSQ